MSEYIGEPRAGVKNICDSQEHCFRIASYPTTNTGNPYIDLFFSALESHNIRLVGRIECDLKWLQKEGKNLDAIHFHWPEKIWRGRPLGRLDKLRHTLTFGSIRGIIQLIRFLKTAKTMGVKRIWTIHNLTHHEGGTWIDRLGYKALIKNVDLLIVHSCWASEKVKGRYNNRAKVITMNHGNYDGIFPMPRPRRVVLDSLGIKKADRPIVSCVGILRKYKGIELACEAVKLLRGKVQLIVGGTPRPYREKGYWHKVVSEVPDAILLDRYLTDQEFSEIVSISDAVLLPYRKITGSGALLAAWTIGSGVVVSSLPFFEEILKDHPDAGMLFNVDDPKDLADSITKYLSIPPLRRRCSALEAAKAFSWGSCVLPFVEEVKHWREARGL